MAQDAQTGERETRTAVALFLGVIAFVVVIAAMREAQSLVVPLLLSMFAAAIAAPAVMGLKRRGLPTAAAISAVVLGMVGMLFVWGSIIGSSIGSFSSRIPAYRQQLTERYQGVLELLGERFGLSAGAITDFLDPGQAMGLAANVLNGLSSALTNAFLILFTMILILFEISSFPDKLRTALPSAQGTLDYFTTVADSLKRYMVIKTGTSLLTGVAVAVWVGLLGLDFPLLWGLLAFFLNYVPTIGSILAAIPAVLLAVVQLGPGGAVAVAAGYLVINVLVGNVIEPRVTGQRMGLSTLVVFLSLLVWGWVLGSVGMLLSVPLTMTVKIALQSSPRTRWVSVLMDSAAPAPRRPPKKKPSAA